MTLSAGEIAQLKRELTEDLSIEEVAENLPAALSTAAIFISVQFGTVGSS